ncbi:hypothetical protein EV702DRAFT_191830 [Suillus placidus]|uniref:Uncharacterized protein n=1 Tax=Suillus placidus TaxID=48579 RepID=A0A9P7D3W0_9AGAM|nr:hypothetical protein EV702DRAFT_191830 [Suillus placidus]
MPLKSYYCNCTRKCGPGGVHKEVTRGVNRSHHKFRDETAEVTPGTTSRQPARPTEMSQDRLHRYHSPDEPANPEQVSGTRSTGASSQIPSEPARSSPIPRLSDEYRDTEQRAPIPNRVPSPEQFDDFDPASFDHPQVRTSITEIDFKLVLKCMIVLCHFAVSRNFLLSFIMALLFKHKMPTASGAIASTTSCCVVAFCLLLMFFCGSLLSTMGTSASFHGVVGPRTSTIPQQFSKILKAVLIVHSFPLSTSMLMDFQR